MLNVLNLFIEDPNPIHQHQDDGASNTLCVSGQGLSQDIYWCQKVIYDTTASLFSIFFLFQIEEIVIHVNITPLQNRYFPVFGPRMQHPVQQQARAEQVSGQSPVTSHQYLHWCDLLRDITCLFHVYRQCILMYIMLCWTKLLIASYSLYCFSLYSFVPLL